MTSMALQKQTKVVKLGKRLRKSFNRMLARYSKVGNPPVFDPAVFAWTRMLEDNWDSVWAEAEQVLHFREAIPPLGQLSPDHERLANDGKWQSFFLWGYGYRIPENCKRCPRTAELVEQIPGLKSALFSIHAPGVHIPRHKGVTKGMITCHLALKVPKEREKCRIFVHDQDYLWEEGKTFVFDDTFKHEVWNDSDEDRVILLVQFARPLRFPGSLYRAVILELIRLSPFVQEARRNMRHWTDRMKAAERAAD